jgi:hypothetical protein
VTLSRTSRIMLGLLLLALAAFLWVNFLVRDSGFDLAFLRAAPAPSAGAETVQTPTVAPESQVARDIEVLDLPFLVTEPPPEPSPVEQEQAAAEAAAEQPRRATVNPFSPVLQRGGAQAAEGQREPQQGRAVTEVPVPAAPAGSRAAAPAPSAPKAPAPAAVTPATRATGTLPRALPGGTLGGTPDLLRSAIGATDVPAENLGRMAAVREPEESRPSLGQAGEADQTRSEPQPLAEPISPRAVAAERAGRQVGQAPLAAGTSSLSRFLRDNNVRFTGSVIGPVSVGVFRSSLTAAPVVISLGQTLPDTSIVLTDLRGQQAELTLGESTQILTLELRR